MASDAQRCESTFGFPEMHAIFECQNSPDVPAEPHRGRPAWSHLHGRWHRFEDVDADGRRFSVEWEATDGD